jgi:hypothetical protein
LEIAMTLMSRRPFLALAGLGLLGRQIGQAAEPPALLPNAFLRDESRDGPPPRAVNQPELIREILVPDTVHQVLIKGTIKVDAEDQAFVPLLRVRGKLTLNYAFEALIERHIRENDGRTIVEDRYFRHVRALKIGSTVRDIQLQPGPAAQLFFDFAPLAPGGPQVIHSLELLQKVLPSATAFLGALLSRSARGDRVAAFWGVHQLTDKAVRLRYVDGKGVEELRPLRGTITQAELPYLMGSMVLSDCLLFPGAAVNVGETFDVEAENFRIFIYPSLVDSLGGTIQLVRNPDRYLVLQGQANDRRHVVVEIKKGGFTFHTGPRSVPGIPPRETGAFSPTGTIYFDADKKLIFSANLSATGELKSMSAERLSHGVTHSSKPELQMTYSCRVCPESRESGPDRSSLSR